MKKVIYLLVISLLVAVFISLYQLSYYFDVMLRTSKNETKNGCIVYSIQHEDNPINKEIENFLKVYDNLKKYEDNEYTYYELYFQYLENIEEKGSFYSEETDELENSCYAIKCIQVSQNVLCNGNIKCIDGRLCDQNDYLYDGKGELPILMGSSYKTKYQIGDVFEWYYLFDKYKFKVIGFLEEESNIHIGTYNIEFDKYIIMPSFDIGKNVRVTDGLKIHYANKTSGIIEMGKEKHTFFNDTIRALLIDTEAGEYSWTAYPLEVQFRDILGISITVLQIIIVALELLILFGSIIVIFKFSKYEYEQGKTIYYNDLLCGGFISVAISLFYCLINYIYIAYAGIVVYKAIHFAIIGLLSYIIILYKKMICKKMISRETRENE